MVDDIIFLDWISDYEFNDGDLIGDGEGFQCSSASKDKWRLWQHRSWVGGEVLGLTIVDSQVGRGRVINLVSG